MGPLYGTYGGAFNGEEPDQSGSSSVHDAIRLCRHDGELNVALNGASIHVCWMNAVLNGISTRCLPLSNAANDRNSTTEKVLQSNHRVLIRYGNVIYPVQRNMSCASAYEKAPLGHRNNL